MPIHTGVDQYGPFVQYGSQMKYYFSPDNIRSFNRANNRAMKQMAAIMYSQYHR